VASLVRSSMPTLRHLGHRLALPRRGTSSRPRNCRRSGHKNGSVGFASGSVQRADIDCDRAALQPGKAPPRCFAAAALRAEQSMSTSTPSSSVCRCIQAAIGASPSARNLDTVQAPALSIVQARHDCGQGRECASLPWQGRVIVAPDSQRSGNSVDRDPNCRRAPGQDAAPRTRCRG